MELRMQNQIVSKTDNNNRSGISIKEYRRNYYLKHKQKIILQATQWRLHHPKEIAAIKRNRRKKLKREHPERYAQMLNVEKEQARIWRKKNPDKHRESCLTWKLKHHDLIQKRNKEFWAANKTECSKKVKIWRNANAERVTETTKLWRKKHPDKVKAWIKKSYAKHSEKIKAYNAKWAKANPDKKRKYNQKWAKNNPEMLKARNHKRRMLKASGPSDKSSIIQENLKKVPNKCYWCGKSLNKNWHMDHVIPLCLGGSHTSANIVKSCPTCNHSKGGKHPAKWKAVRQLVML
jgi:hypothetical protein